MRRTLVRSVAVAALVGVLGTAMPIEHVGRGDGGTILVPSGQRLAPAGTRIEFDGRPYSLALSPDKKTLAVANTDSLDLIDTATLARSTYPYPGEHAKKGTVEAAQGLVFSPDGGTIFVSTNKTAVLTFSTATRSFSQPIDFAAAGSGQTSTDPHAGERGPAPLPMGLAISPDGSTLDVALDGDNDVAAVTIGSGAQSTVKTGVAPVTLARSGDTLAALNWGGSIPSPTEPSSPSGETGQSVRVDPATGIARGGTVTILDAKTLAVRHTIAVGRHPIAAAFVDARTLLVAEANDDRIATIDIPSGRVVEQRLSLPGDGGFGLAPQALAYDAASARLYVALAGADAVAAYDARVPARLRFVGAIPTDWYPGALALLPHGGLAIANLKGVGSLGEASNDPPGPDDVPNCSGSLSSGAHIASLALPNRPLGTYDTHAYRGTIDVVTSAELARIGAATTARAVALANATREPAGALPKVEHVLYVIKENKTYDQVLGDDPRGNGDPGLVSFGRRITPNIHRIVDRYALLDNFYTVGVQSGDGHQWTDEADTTDYIERSPPDWARSYPNAGDDPLAYAASGFIWQNALRHGRTVRDYGEFTPTSFSPADASWSDFRHDRATFSVRTNIPTLRAAIDPAFPGFSRRIPDQVRADAFIADLHRDERTGKLPNLMIMSLPDDHTEGFSPAFPTPCAMVADNDYALGRIVAALSRSPFWRTTLVLVTEDDAQDGYDHVDGHRTIGLMIGPMVRRHAVVSNFYSQLSMVRTAETLLGLPPMNRFDAAAPVMSAALTTALDVRPYDAVPPKISLDTMNAPVGAAAAELGREATAWNPDVPDNEPRGAMRRQLWLATH